jgi:16S rRNA (guanine527-N7)-methyltransferase
MEIRPATDHASSDEAESAAASDETLPSALAKHDISLPPEQVALLETYARRLWRLNSQLNLTRHTTFDKFVSRDLVDSLQLANVLEGGERVLDVGSGGGVPGVVLAIVRPDLQVSLAESVAKRARALRQIVEGLGPEITVYHCRAEEVVAARNFESLVARAVAPLAKLLRWFAPHWEAFDRLLVIKGPSWVEERREARQRNLLARVQLRKRVEWPLPGTNAQSVLLEMRPKEI